MKAVILDIVDNVETVIPEGSYAVFGEGRTRIRIIVRNESGKEVVEINSEDTLQIEPRASNSVFLRTQRL